jgi:anaerobic ribonucleoside-triphosphate reductase activating protein
MRIAQFQKNSFIDMPGYVACVVYTQGCNMNCEFCHNKALIPQVDPEYPVEWEKVISWLKTRQGLIDAVVFSGGEPTIQEDLLERMEEVNHLDFAIGLHTNGAGAEFDTVTQFCDYVLLSKHTPEKIDIAMKAKHLSLSDVLWDEEKKDWYNKITKVK